MLKNVVLIGFMGTGKTVIGKRLARDLGYEFVDTDSLIEEQEGRSVSEVFRNLGEAHFRKVEKRVIHQVSDRDGIVVATGGGAVLDPDNVAALTKRGWLIRLAAQPQAILSRLEGQGDRPLLSTQDREREVRRLLKHRRPFYAQADYSLETDRMSVGQATREIQHWLTTRLSHRLSVKLPLNPYEIEIGWGMLEAIGHRLTRLGLGQKVAVVTNSRVRRFYGPTVLRSLKKEGFDILLIEIPDGERFKTTRWISHIYDALIQHKFERGSCLMALGGGVIGDMTGFAAATYLRGISYIQVPTTLIAQVDSSIGGKTGVNHPQGKNLIGAFYQPRFVFIDVKVLETLDRRNFISGLAEVIKYGIIADAELCYYLERYLPKIIDLNRYYLLPAIRRSCEIKAQVVQEDEREGGRRKILNYGHTLGHALEAATAYKRYLHGEAISIGMVFAARLAHDLGLCTQKTVHQQETLLARAGLPVGLPKPRPADILKTMTYDKKVKEGEIHFVLADRIGHVQVRSVKQAQIRDLL